MGTGAPTVTLGKMGCLISVTVVSPGPSSFASKPGPIFHRYNGNSISEPGTLSIGDSPAAYEFPVNPKKHCQVPSTRISSPCQTVHPGWSGRPVHVAEIGSGIFTRRGDPD